METTTVWNRIRYTLYAPVYDYAVGTLGLFNRGRKRALELAELQSGEQVLLVAAGTGLDLPHIPAGVEVVATDITPAMVDRLERRAQKMEKKVRAEVMDAANLNFPDKSFDCVVLHLALAVVPDPVAAIQEASRVLKPGGRVSIFDKFLEDEAHPSFLRRLVSGVTTILFSNLNRKLGPLLKVGDLQLRRREAVGLGGNFVAARADKPL